MDGQECLGNDWASIDRTGEEIRSTLVAFVHLSWKPV
jgi:hypothetical protein